MSARPDIRGLGVEPDTYAPDGAEVRLLAGCSRGSMAHFMLRPGQVTRAVSHHTVEELWFFLEGHGRMALKSPGGDWREVEALPGVSLSIPLGTHFQFRNDGDGPFAAVAVTMPPWPVDREEAFPVDGLWQATV